MEEKKKYNHQEEENKVNAIDSNTAPGQYSAEEFDEYLNTFECDLLKGEECFYTAEEVAGMMGKW